MVLIHVIAVAQIKSTLVLKICLGGFPRLGIWYERNLRAGHLRKSKVGMRVADRPTGLNRYHDTRLRGKGTSIHLVMIKIPAQYCIHSPESRLDLIDHDARCKRLQDAHGFKFSNLEPYQALPFCATSETGPARAEWAVTSLESNLLQPGSHITITTYHHLQVADRTKSKFSAPTTPLASKYPLQIPVEVPRH